MGINYDAAASKRTYRGLVIRVGERVYHRQHVSGVVTKVTGGGAWIDFKTDVNGVTLRVHASTLSHVRYEV